MYCQKENIASYLQAREDVINSGLWDERFYLSRYYHEYKIALEKKLEKNPNINFQPIDHYLQVGWKYGLLPSDKFVLKDKTNRYANPLVDFIRKIRFNGYQFEKNVWPADPKVIENYNENQSKRKATGVIYTCIDGDYDNLIIHRYIDFDYDYICFTNNEELLKSGTFGVWKIKPLAYTQRSSSDNNRWHKMHPHILFPDYDYSVYIDANINILTPYLFNLIKSRNTDLLLPRHYNRDCIYQEICFFLENVNFAKYHEAYKKHQKLLKEAGFPNNYGLGENNIIYRKHHQEQIKTIMNEWWQFIENGINRDQFSFAYVLWKNKLQIQNYTFVNTRVDYRDFWVVKHNQSIDKNFLNLFDRGFLAPFNNNHYSECSYNKLKLRYIRYALLSKITFGKLRKKYKQKRKELKSRIKSIKKSLKERHDQRH